MSKRNTTKKKERMRYMSKAEIDKITDKAIAEATTKSFIYMLAIPTMVVRDKFAGLMRKEVNGLSREERFVDMCLDVYESIYQDYVELSDLTELLKKETGIDFKQIESNYKKGN
ncbi:MAG: hypothetical protein HP023_06805 [Lachnospiraceae bacterium]|nr:hypothetical protein [Lachnospiraceae bacterium]